VQDELLQVDGASEEGKRGRDDHFGRVAQAIKVEFLDGIDPEGTEEWKWSRMDFREPPNLRPVVTEVEVPDFLSVGGEQCYCADGVINLGDYV